MAGEYGSTDQSGNYLNPYSYQALMGNKSNTGVNSTIWQGMAPTSRYAPIMSQANSSSGLQSGAGGWENALASYGFAPALGENAQSAAQYGQAAQSILPTLLAQGPMMNQTNQWGQTMTSPNPYWGQAQTQNEWQKQFLAQQLAGQQGLQTSGIQESAAAQQALNTQAEQLAEQQMQAKAALLKTMLEDQWSKFQSLGINGTSPEVTGLSSIADVDLDPLRIQAEAQKREILNKYAAGSGSRRRALEGVDRNLQSGISAAAVGGKKAGLEAGITSRGQNLSALASLLQSINL